MGLFWSTHARRLHDGRHRAYDPASGAWIEPQEAAGESDGLRPVAPVEAVALLVASGGGRRRPVGVVGPGDASAEELAAAERVGAGLAGLGLPMICGGRGGCMAAASRGHAAAGGLVIGVLPSGDWTTANRHVAVPIATGLGEARNAVIASACFALVAVGGGHGTLSEMALGLKMGRLVVAMPPADRVAGALPCDTVEAALDAVARRYLGLDG